jgi:2-polyprenyl-6-methoxyphenol hydroxylase-like FAD-dependent oxidoreductase
METALLPELRNSEEKTELLKAYEQVIKNQAKRIILLETQLKTLKLKQTPAEKLLQNLELLGI